MTKIIICVLVAVVVATGWLYKEAVADVVSKITSSDSDFVEVPGIIPFQGSLTYKETGNVVPDREYEIVFSLYNVATGGAAVWTETQTHTTKDGVFVTNLGGYNPITPKMVSHA